MNAMSNSPPSSDRFAVRPAYSHIPDAAQRPENVDYRQAPYRASTSPPVLAGSPPQSTYPRTMYPGYRPPHATHRTDIFFINPQQTTNMTRYNPLQSVSRSPNGIPSTATQSYSTNQPPFFPIHPPTPPSSVSSPPRPPKPSALQQQSLAHVPSPVPTFGSFASPPPVPPKPFPNNTSIPPDHHPGAYLEMMDSKSINPDAYTSGASEPDIDEHDLAAALALSRSESEQEAERLKDLARQEEEELAMAMQASMLTVAHTYDYYESEAGPSHWITYDTRSSPIHDPASVGTTSSPLTVEQHLQGLSLSQKPAITLPEPEIAPKLKTDVLNVEIDGVIDSAHPNEELDSDLPYLSSSFREEPPMRFPVPEYRPPTPTATLFSGTGSLSQTISGKEEAVDIPSGGEPNKFASSPLTEMTSATESMIHPSSQTPISTSVSTPPSALNPSYIFEDEALARKLAAEEATYHENRRNSSDSSAIRCHDADGRTAPVDPPPYSSSPTKELSRVASLAEIRKNSKSAPTSNTARSRNPSAGFSMPTASPPPAGLSSLNQLSSHDHGLKTSELKLIMGRASSTSALPQLHRFETQKTPAEFTAINPAGSLTRSSTSDSVTLPTPNLTIEITPNRASAAGLLNADHFINQELLYGISYGFSPPAMSATLSTMQAPLPGAIGLSYGRCPPFHLQAPSWRHILKLMARLSNARLEATLEALAINKNEGLKLRTVVQFVRPHHMTEEWRTILWFTVDHPVPPNTLGAQKYSPTNVNVLPWSYTLTTIPTTLRNPFDDMLSKTYTVPATHDVPFPSLPITFPNLALYLQAALDDSRRQPESSSLSRLAKMVKTCYPLDFADIPPATPEKTSVSGLFKKVIGRGNRSKQKEHGGNEETYDLVTPFVPEEWG